MKTIEIIECLRNRYPTNRGEWAFFTEVPNGTGSNKERSCDALAVNLWPSGGLVWHGHEVKASRSDWLKEIQDPSKAEAFAKHCDYWWIVAPANVLKVEELPTDWGWICPLESGNARVKKPANKRTPEPCTREFLAGICRAAYKNSSDDLINQVKQTAYIQGRKDGSEVIKKNNFDWEKKNLERENEQLKEAMGEFIEFRSKCRSGEYRIENLRSSAERLMVDLKQILETSKAVDLVLTSKSED